MPEYLYRDFVTCRKMLLPTYLWGILLPKYLRGIFAMVRPAGPLHFSDDLFLTKNWAAGASCKCPTTARPRQRPGAAAVGNQSAVFLGGVGHSKRVGGEELRRPCPACHVAADHAARRHDQPNHLGAGPPTRTRRRRCRRRRHGGGLKVAHEAAVQRS